MRRRSFAVAALAGACWAACSNSGSTAHELPPVDHSADFTGTWIGTQTGTVNGSPAPVSTAGLDVTRQASNQVLLEGVCPDGSAVPALVTAEDALTVPRFTCPVTALTGCSAVTMTWTSGGATLENGLLSLAVGGTLAGCGKSLAIKLQFDALRDAPPPRITGLAPTWVLAGSPGMTLVVNGAGFAPKAMVSFGGLAVPTTFVSATELHAMVPATALALATEVLVTAANVDAQLSLPSRFEVDNPVPVLAAIAPDRADLGTPGGTFTLNGSGFVAGSTAAIDGSVRMTTYVASTRLQVTLNADDLTVAGVHLITVTNPGPGGGTSAAASLSVLNPAPDPTGVFPTTLATGTVRAFVTVTGSRLAPGATVFWNGSPRRTLVASPTLASFELLKEDLGTPGTGAVSIQNPPPGGGTADAGTVSVETPAARPAQAVAYQLDAAHTGHTHLGGTLAFPGAPAWSIALPDAASYPLIAEGRVFVLVRGPSSGTYGTRLSAIDLATGAVLWGPVAIPGNSYWAGHAYDGGKVFVLTFDGRLRAFDAATGAAGWNVSMPGQYAFSAAPSAADGVVYVGGAGVGGTVYAVDEATGSVRWTQSVWNGDESSPAVAPDAVYVSYPCQVYKLDRLTGGTIWHDQGGCEGGGGKTAAYSDGDVYVRDLPFLGESPGTIHDGFDGSSADGFGSGSNVPIPAVAGSTRYVLAGGALQRWERGATQPAWSFTGDAQLASAPLVIDEVVVIGSGSGTVYAVDAATGQAKWSGSAGAGIPWPDEQNVSQPLTGLGAGEGYLVVPAGSRLTAWKITP